ncbi:MAG: hypothetical protein RL591_2581 [Planctomycetota bacterium]
MTGNASPDPSRDQAPRASDKLRVENRFESLMVLWRGDRELAIFKPAGLSSERPSQGDAARSNSPTQSFSARDCALERAKLQFGWPDARLPHRLDRPTSGILMIAADAGRVADHAREIAERKWTKFYIARLETRTTAGDAAQLVGRHRAYLRREGRLARCVRSGGDPASLEILDVTQAMSDARHSHVLIRLETGRFHQIRVMMANLGFPLVGDIEYGGRAWRASVQTAHKANHEANHEANHRAERSSKARASIRNADDTNSGLELLAAGLRIDRPDGAVIIEAHAAPTHSPSVSPIMLQKLRALLSVAAK